MRDSFREDITPVTGQTAEQCLFISKRAVIAACAVIFHIRSEPRRSAVPAPAGSPECKPACLMMKRQIHPNQCAGNPVPGNGITKMRIPQVGFGARTDRQPDLVRRTQRGGIDSCFSLPDQPQMFNNLRWHKGKPEPVFRLISGTKYLSCPETG